MAKKGSATAGGTGAGTTGNLNAAATTGKRARSAEAKQERKPKPGRGAKEKDLVVSSLSVPFFQATLLSLNRTKNEKFWVGPPPAQAAPAATSADPAAAVDDVDGEAATDSDEGTSAVATEADPQAAAAAASETQCVYAKLGRKPPTVFDLEPEELAEYQELLRLVQESSGIHIESYPFASELERFASRTAYLLVPKVDDGFSELAYETLRQGLLGTSSAGFGWFSTGTTRHAYFGLFASGDWVVLRQLPNYGEYHQPEQLAQPTWKQQIVPADMKEAMVRAITGNRIDAIVGSDLRPPLEYWLATIADGKRLVGAKPQSSPLQFGTPAEAIQAMLRSKKRSSPTTELRKAKPR